MSVQYRLSGQIDGQFLSTTFLSHTICLCRSILVIKCTKTNPYTTTPVLYTLLLSGVSSIIYEGVGCFRKRYSRGCQVVPDQTIRLESGGQVRNIERISA